MFKLTALREDFDNIAEAIGVDGEESYEVIARVLCACYISDALHDVASSIRALGNGNASTEMGAIENLAKEIRESGTAIATALGDA